MLEPLSPSRRPRQQGLTLIELLVGIAIVALLITLAAPSFRHMIDIQRLRSINASLITDLQYARAEAISRNDWVKIRFDKTGTAVSCYVILTGDANNCDCKAQPGVNVCAGSGTKELRTVQVERSLRVALGVPDTQSITKLAFDPATGRLMVAPVDAFEPPTGPFLIEVKNDDIGGFRNSLEATGRPSVCSPSGRISGVTAC